MKGTRIDKRLLELGFAPSRSKAQALVMAGIVLVNDQRVEKPSERVSEHDTIRLKGSGADTKFVGRGGLKLEKALREFSIDPGGSVCLDIGSSTGGFTDCMLQNGAKRVVAIDVGTNQLDWKLRSDERVESRENVNARYIRPDDFEEQFDLITMDVSFISVTLILDNLVPLLKPDGAIVTLVKPQFEVGKGEVGKGGIVRDELKHEEVVEKIIAYGCEAGLRNAGRTESPILGAEGNREFLVYFVLD
ncbi:MAG: TlyA family RNA methyltransferase [Pyrinomonadaceae bacterium]|nr:TlyA family RNA methyltransferase [Pyrinomonadaceae bacterium]